MRNFSENQRKWKVIRNAEEASLLKKPILLWIVTKQLKSFFAEEKIRRRNFKCSRKHILPKSDAPNFNQRQSRTLNLLFATSPLESLFFSENYLSPRPHSLHLPVAHGTMGIIARIVFHLPMTPYVLCLRQESGAWGRHSYYSHFLAG